MTIMRYKSKISKTICEHLIGRDDDVDLSDVSELGHYVGLRLAFIMSANQMCQM